ncbi:molybdopterin-dependent oxidoreductase [Psychromarinibacter halotolerans]|uniref:Molybdopterin-dependent oxidoreductase n=1 Tax=Psychromarinibacter halotolerans TaxID=1775175 RepID=A0ABV7GQ21_9RHOB|nr:molybdopterin-dependent oxidoreductase [Psychromarinibacter halotolerans]MDF0597762.1 molybdopterin-dependent oxidoreductase [Psychromarinibacter halotolerans]
MLSFLTRAIFSVTLLLPVAASAQDLSAPEGEVILTVSGAIAITNDGDTATFDLAMLEAMDTVTVETTTIWTEGTQSFTGVPLGVLMDAVGANGAMLNATAINDYSVEIPADDWVEGGAIVAYQNNGKAMSVRDKGPLWVIYPYDDDPDYQTEVIYSRSIWQLDRIVVAE